MSEETKVEFSSWKEAFKAINAKMTANAVGQEERFAEMFKESFRKHANEEREEILTLLMEPVKNMVEKVIDEKLDTVVTEKVTNASFNKIDEEVLPGMWSAIQNRDKQYLEQAEKIIAIDNKFESFMSNTREEIASYLNGKFQTELMDGFKDGMNNVREELDRFRETNQDYIRKIENFEDNITRISNQQILDSTAIERLEEEINNHPKENDKTPEETEEESDTKVVAKDKKPRKKTKKKQDKDKAPRAENSKELRGREKRKSIIGNEPYATDYASTLELGKDSDDSEGDSEELSSDEEELLSSKRSAKTKGGAKLIKIFSPADHPSLKLTNPYDTEGVIDFIENFEIMAMDYPDGDCSMVKCLSTEARNKLLAHGRTMRGNIQKACISPLGLKALTEQHIKKLLYDMNKAKSPTDMISKVKRITFMKDGSKFEVSNSNMPAFYDQLMLFNARFLKLIKCYSLRASDDSLLTLFKKNNVKGVADYYLDALPDKSGRVFWEEIVSVNPKIRESKTIDSLVEKFRKHIEKKRTLALQFRDMGKSLHLRSADVVSDSKSNSGNHKSSKENPPRKVFFSKRPQRVNALADQREEYGGEESGTEDQGDIYDEGNEQDDEQESAEFNMDEVYQQVNEFEAMNPMHDDSAEEHMSALDIKSHGRQFQKPKGDVRAKVVTPCFVKFLRGKCDNKDCVHSHDDAMMLKVAIGRFKDVAQSKFAPDRDYAKKLLDQAYEEVSKTSSAKPVVTSKGFVRT